VVAQYARTDIRKHSFAVAGTGCLTASEQKAGLRDSNRGCSLIRPTGPVKHTSELSQDPQNATSCL
jgi:hypothetical protein